MGSCVETCKDYQATGFVSICKALDTADVSVAASLIGAVTLLAPSDWSDPGFFGESRAE